jgi:hypothetical protein
MGKSMRVNRYGNGLKPPKFKGLGEGGDGFERGALGQRPMSGYSFTLFFPTVRGF